MDTYFYLWVALMGILLIWAADMCKVGHNRTLIEQQERRRRIVEGDNPQPGGNTHPRIPRWVEV